MSDLLPLGTLATVLKCKIICLTVLVNFFEITRFFVSTVDNRSHERMIDALKAPFEEAGVT